MHRLDNTLREGLGLVPVKVRVKILAMGGSIESIIDARGIKTVSSEILQRTIQSSEFELPFQLEKICNIASHSLSQREIVLLAKSLNMVEENVIPVITTGTDSLEEVAFLVSLLKPKSGALVAATLKDGSQEVIDSLISSILNILLNYSILNDSTPVVVDNHIYEAREFTEEMLYFKTNSEDGINTDRMQKSFAGINGALLSPLEKEELLRGLEFDWPSVLILNSTVANYPKGLDKTIENSDIVILQGFGAGNTNVIVDALLQERFSNRKPVILLTAHPTIPLKPVSSAMGGNVNLLGSGVWNGQGLSVRKAALLSTLLFHFEGHGRALFEKIANVLGSAGQLWD